MLKTKTCVGLVQHSQKVYNLVLYCKLTNECLMGYVCCHGIMVYKLLYFTNYNWSSCIRKVYKNV